MFGVTNEKDFDGWNKMKKDIHGKTLPDDFFYHAREVWWCTLGANVGYEQDGTGPRRERPVVILRGFSTHVCLVVPLSTSLKKNPYYISVGEVNGRQASAIVSQLRLIDTRRFTNKIGMLEKDAFERIRKAARGLL